MKTWFGFFRWFAARNEIITAPKAVYGREVGLAEGFSLLELERAGLRNRQYAVQPAAIGAVCVETGLLNR